MTNKDARRWRYPDEIFAVQYGNGIVGAHDGSLKTSTPHRKYVRADRGSFYQEKDIDAMQDEIARLKSAVRGLLNCPHIADRDTDMEWAEPETETAVEKAWQALEGDTA